MAENSIRNHFSRIELEKIGSINADENSLLNGQGGPTVVTFEDEHVPPIVKTDQAIVESAPEPAVEPENTKPELYPEIPLIDQPTDTQK